MRKVRNLVPAAVILGINRHQLQSTGTALSKRDISASQLLCNINKLQSQQSQRLVQHYQNQSSSCLKIRPISTMADFANMMSPVSGDTNSPAQVRDMSDSYILVDIGANLTNKKFSRDIDSVVQRAKEAGVQKIMVTGTTISASKEALRLTRIFPDVLFSTAGIHPHDATSWDEYSADEIESLCSNSECVALGECGLDFNRNFSPPEVQLEVFEKQVQLACKLKKSMFLHERDAHDELISVLKKYQDSLPPCVIHCFTGTVNQAKAYLDLGLYLGITGYVWKDKSEDGVRKCLQDNIIPLDRLLVETDAPFMYPNTRSAKFTDLKQVISPRSLNYLNRHCTFQRNEPCSLAATVEMISALMNKPPEEVAMQTTYNAVKLFGLT